MAKLTKCHMPFLYFALKEKISYHNHNFRFSEHTRTNEHEACVSSIFFQPEWKSRLNVNEKDYLVPLSPLGRG